VSLTVTSKVQVLGVPSGGTEVQVTVVVPTGKKNPGAGIQLTVSPQVLVGGV
jgi:hypothetical protein